MKYFVGALLSLAGYLWLTAWFNSTMGPGFWQTWYNFPLVMTELIVGALIGIAWWSMHERSYKRGN